MLHPDATEVLVSRTTPHLILAATQPWLSAAGFTQADAVGRSLSVLQGEGTCRVTLGALWSALQVRTPGDAPRAAPRLDSAPRAHPRASPPRRTLGCLHGRIAPNAGGCWTDS